MTKLDELDQALSIYCPSKKEQDAAVEALKRRETFVTKFPGGMLDRLTPETYCIGHGDKDNFCWWIERGTKGFSYYFPGSSMSYGMFWDKKGGIYRMTSALSAYRDAHPDADEEIVLREVVAKPLQNFVLSKGDKGTFDKARYVVGESFLLKVLILYYPNDFFQVNSTIWIDTIIREYQLENPDSYVNKNRVLRSFYEQKKKLVKNGNLTQQAFVGIVARQLGLAKPRYWHMQLHPGSDSDFSQKDVLEILQRYGVIGMGDGWENDGGQPEQFKEEVEIGDIIGIREKGFVALVRVAGPCQKNKKQSELNWFDIVRPVEILSVEAEDYMMKYKAETGKNAHDNLYNPSTLSEVKPTCKNRFLRFWYKSVMGQDVSEGEESDASSKGEVGVDASSDASDGYGKDQFLKEVFVSPETFDEMKMLLENKKNIILSGAPGVGKTFAARRLAWAMMGTKDNSRVEFVQFHQNYAYEDFICGYKPTPQGGFELRDGVFYDFCRKARENPGKTFFFIIDEINRGNLSKIFGELLMLIEADKRGKESYAVRLAYKPDELFTVPDNLYLIGMMNTADRSLAMMDYALRRRFSFVTMTPGFDTTGFCSRVFGNEKLTKLVDAVKKLNEVIAADASLGKGFVIGHSFFCGGSTPEQIVRHDIGPTLNEYWFDNPVRAEDERTKLENALK